MNNRMMSWILGLIIILGVAWVAFGKGGMSTASSKDYKAVFLTNGQVYFGKVANENMKPLVMTDIYYLQVQQQLQQGQSADKQQQVNQQIQLVKLGNELHGPKDEMRINADQILLVESLKEDGQVVKTIHEYQKNGAPTATPAATDTTSATPAATDTTKKK